MTSFNSEAEETNKKEKVVEKDTISIDSRGTKRKSPEHSHLKHKRRKCKPLRNVITPIDLYLRGHVPIQAYFNRAIRLLDTENQPYIILHALGKLIPKAVSLANILQAHSFKNYSMEVNTDSVKAIDELIYEDDTLDSEMDVRHTSAIHIKIHNRPQ